MQHLLNNLFKLFTGVLLWFAAKSAGRNEAKRKRAEKVSRVLKKYEKINSSPHAPKSELVKWLRSQDD